MLRAVGKVAGTAVKAAGKVAVRGAAAVGNHIKQRIMAMPREVEAAGMRMASQGAAEVGQALYGQSNAYVPYGPTEKPLSVQQGNVYGAANLPDYQQALTQAAQRPASKPQGKGMSR